MVESVSKNDKKNQTYFIERFSVLNNAKCSSVTLASQYFIISVLSSYFNGHISILESYESTLNIHSNLNIRNLDIVNFVI